MCWDIKETFELVLKRMEERTPAEARQFLIDSKILDPDGELADHYCNKRQLKEKKARRENGRQLR